MGGVEGRVGSSRAGDAYRVLKGALLSGAVLGSLAFLVIAMVTDGLAGESASFSLVGVVLSALVGCLIAGVAACAGLVVMRLVSACGRQGRLRVCAGSLAAGLAAWLLTRILIVPELLLPSLLPAIAGCVGCAMAAVILSRSQRRQARDAQ
jgi:hypothetical protein